MPVAVPSQRPLQHEAPPSRTCQEAIPDPASLGPSRRPPLELPKDVRGAVVTGTAFSRTLREREREEVLPTTVEGLDQVLHGGLPRGTMVELVGRRSCGRFATLMASLAGMTAIGSPAALVDLGDHLDPRAAADAGVVLERLLWVRPKWLPDAVAAAEDLVAAGVPLVAVDLGSPPVRGRTPAAAWVRLARRALAHQAAVLVSSPYQLSGWAAEQVVKAGRGRGLWTGMPRGWRLLRGLDVRFAVVRRRGTAPGDEAGAELVVADAAFGPVETAATAEHAEPACVLAR